MADGTVPAAVTRVRTIRAADLFCGAGGASTGLARAVERLGLALRLHCVNHWPTAIDTHRCNHPSAIHVCADLESARPLAIVPDGALDLLIAAPTCTYHSRARNGRPTSDQQRMDPWHVVRWCTELRVRRLMIENVPEFVDWSPVSKTTGRPIQSRRGEYFRAWVAALRAIGFHRIDHRVICAADYGDATTRQRFVLIASSDRGPLRWPEPTHARGGACDLLGTRSPWRSAADIIDWSIPGTSIFNRRKALVPNTLRRILGGAEREGWPEVLKRLLSAAINGHAPDLSPVDTWAGTAGTPLVMSTLGGGTARPVSEPIPTVCGGGNGARPHFIVPLIAPYYSSGSGLTSRPATEPLDTITTKARFGLAVPAIDQGTGYTVEIGGQLHQVDILYRMLRNHELARAMGFSDGTTDYQFVGTQAEVTKQIGNAIPTGMAGAIAGQLIEDMR